MSKKESGKDQGTAKYQPAEPVPGDVVHMIARAGISSIPLVGGAGAELFSAIVQPPLELRRKEWMKQVGDALRSLEDNHGIDLEELRGNDVFLDCVLTASQIAMRTSQEGKRCALRNAILNSALPHPPEESRQQFFLYLIDTFTVWHLRLMKLFQDPLKWAKLHNHQFPNLYIGGLSSILESAYPELCNQRSFYDQVWQDVNTHGLTRTPGLHTTMTTQGCMARRLSELGEEFMHFIEESQIRVGDV